MGHGTHSNVQSVTVEFLPSVSALKEVRTTERCRIRGVGVDEQSAVVGLIPASSISFRGMRGFWRCSHGSSRLGGISLLDFRARGALKVVRTTRKCQLRGQQLERWLRSSSSCTGALPHGEDEGDSRIEAKVGGSFWCPAHGCRAASTGTTTTTSRFKRLHTSVATKVFPSVPDPSGRHRDGC